MVISKHKGFTLLEVLIVVAVIGILAAVAYPSYQKHIISTKRANMMVDLQGMASKIESKKMMHGNYAGIPRTAITSITQSMSNDSSKLYTVAITPSPLTNQWTITATPIANTIMADDGILSLNHSGQKCHKTTCGTGDEWRK